MRQSKGSYCYQYKDRKIEVVKATLSKSRKWYYVIDNNIFSKVYFKSKLQALDQGKIYIDSLTLIND